MYSSKVLKAITIEVLNKSVEKFLDQIDRSKSTLVNVSHFVVGKTFVAIIIYKK